jgi:hypothetical protein
MHPDHMKLRQYCDGDLARTAAESVDMHVRSCDFCREFCHEYRALNRTIAEYRDISMPAKAERMAGAMFRQALYGRVIPFSLFDSGVVSEPACLAADAGEKPPPWIENLATFVSQNPEVVLRIMRDNRDRKDYVQLVSEDETVIARVLVQAADLDLSVLTDEHGRATLADPCPDDVTAINWTIRLPDAEFSLEPFSYDAEKAEYEQEIVLETERKDRVAVRFEGRAESKRISVRILELNGRADFEPVSVAVSQGAKSLIAGISGKDILFFDISGGDDSIDIRLFHQ